MRLILHVAALPLTVLFLMPGVAQAQNAIPRSGIYKTGEQVFQLCTSKKVEDVGMCDYFLMGAHDSFIYLQDIGEIDKAICLPTGTGSEVIRQVAVDYWRANPDARKHSAVSTFWNALVARFPAPCK